MKLTLAENIFDSTMSNGRLFDIIEFLKKEMNKVKNIKPLVYDRMKISPNNARFELINLASRVLKFVELCKDHQNLHPKDKEEVLELFNDFRNVTTDSFEEMINTIQKMLVEYPFLWSSLTKLQIDIEPFEVIYISNYSNIEY